MNTLVVRTAGISKSRGERAGLAGREHLIITPDATPTRPAQAGSTTPEDGTGPAVASPGQA